MARYVDADATLEIYKGWLPQLARPEDKGDRTGVETCIIVLENAPTADVVGVKHGYWKREKLVMCEPYYLCSICGKLHDQEYLYCNECGAKMDGRIEER